MSTFSGRSAIPGHEFHPAAAREYLDAATWYARRSPQAAARFVQTVELTIQQIVQAPQRWPVYLLGTRKLKTARYPYLIIYRVQHDRVQIVAVAHGHRRPGYWRDRSP